MVNTPDQQQQPQQNPMDGILDQQQQAKLAACKTADDMKHFLEEKAQDALTAEQKAEAQKYWEEHDSPQAQAAADKAQKNANAQDMALLGGIVGGIVKAFEFTADYAAGRGGANSLGALAGPPGGGLFAALLSGFEAPTQNGGPAPPAPNKPNSNLTLS